MTDRAEGRSLPDPEDARLVALVRGGDRAAFEELYERHVDWMMAVALRHVGDRAVASDVVQDAVLHWWSRFPGFVLVASVRSYLYPVVRHAALDRLRRDRGRSRSDLDALGAEADGGEAVGAGPGLEDVRDLDEALARLAPGQREVLLLHFGDGLSLSEIAAALELPLGTVKSRLGTALAALRGNERLRRRCFDDEKI